MEISKFRLPDALSLGNGLKAVKAWPGQGPLVLVEVVDSDGERHKARLDLNKLVFIDELPREPSVSGMHSLVDILSAELVDEKDDL